VPMLSLLGNYLFGYRVSWPGLAVGVVEAGGFGFALGWCIAKPINLLAHWRGNGGRGVRNPPLGVGEEVRRGFNTRDGGEHGA